jgi:hypothetical protein
MENDQYTALWSQPDNAKTFIVVDIQTDQDKGSIVADSLDEALSLLNRNVERGVYPKASILVEIVADGTLN